MRTNREIMTLMVKLGDQIHTLSTSMENLYIATVYFPPASQRRNESMCHLFHLIRKSIYTDPSFIFVGLGHMMEQWLISNAWHLVLPTAFGIEKIMRNMLALQQSIKMLTNDQEDTNFERAKQYYRLFFMAPQVCCQVL